ncbi:MAG: hypothetical protein ACYTBJ_04015 [Planctomycetota bacterium]|jgi:hypothetical protein
MFRKLVEKIKELNRTTQPFDPSSLEDPVAARTQWTPLVRGGANFCTHKLFEVTPHRIEFRASLGSKLFCMAFLLVGLGVLIGFSYKLISEGSFKLDFDTIGPILFGLVFAGVGGAMLYFLTKPSVFDKTTGYFWKGRRSPDQVLDKDSIKHLAALAQVHALQLISEYCSGSKSSYYSYELNLVLKDGQRVNVIDHGNINRIRQDAQTLSNFLGKPMWDAL